ncbi:MAG: endolytic transglycosylase MltG [Oscillospiraceae bacterium]|nr:endolytic transglycosylase MltG [Oscillospiraceae bacterium]
MSKDSETIDQIFKIHEEARQDSSRKIEQIHPETGRLKKEERGWANAKAAREQAEPEETYRPLQKREDQRTGCLGGLMYTAFILCLSVILAVLAWMAASDALALNKAAFTATVVLPDSIFKSETVDVTDEEGNITGRKTVSRADISYLSNTLKQAGLIEYKWLFEFFCGISHAEEKVRPGEYQLQSTYDYRAMIQHMRPNGGSAVTVDITFYEGMTMREVFVRLERQGVSSFDDLMDAAENYAFRYKFLETGEENGAARLEGYLFPETYNFYVNMQASSAINILLEQFSNELSESLSEQLLENNYSLKEIVTIASMIEKEAADDEERADIASVIYNRLSSGTPLGIDATILYIHPEHSGAPTSEMLAEKSPYNTRLNTGLTPTPICNPGLASLEAALNPNSTDYYYYALDTATGRHRFFSSQEEFNAFVATQDYS